jgi:hypothetical protein
MRKLMLCGLASGLIGSLVGCEALLGSFEVATQPLNDSGANDATNADTGATDGGEDVVDAAVYLMQCDVSRTPRAFASLAGGYREQIHAFRISSSSGGDTVRVVAQARTAPSLFVYSFNPHDEPIVSVDTRGLNYNGEILDVRRGLGQIFALMLENSLGAPVHFIQAATIRDDDPTPVSVRLSTDMSGNFSGGGSLTGAGFQLSASEYVYAYSRPAAVQGQSDMLIAKGNTLAPPPTPEVFYSGQSEQTTRITRGAVSAGRMLVFDDQPPVPESPTNGTAYWNLPASGALAASPIPPTAITLGPVKPHAMLAVTSLGPTGVRAAVGEVDFNAPVGEPFGTLKIGVIPPTSFDAIDAKTLPPAFSLSSLLEAPFGGGNVEFFGDDFVWIGPPPDPQQGQGLNFYWYDPKLGAMRGKRAGENKLIPEVHDIAATSLVTPLRDALTGLGGTFEVIFVRNTVAADGGTEGQIFLTEITCTR